MAACAAVRAVLITGRARTFGLKCPAPPPSDVRRLFAFATSWNSRTRCHPRALLSPHSPTMAPVRSRNKGKEPAAAEVDLTGDAADVHAGVTAPMDLAGASGSAPTAKPDKPKPVKRKASDSSVEVVMDITGAGAGGASGSSAPVKPKGAVKRTASVEIVAVTQPQPRALPQAAGATQAPAMRGPERFDDELGTQLEEEDEMARLVCFGAFSTAAVGIQYYKGRAR